MPGAAKVFCEKPLELVAVFFVAGAKDGARMDGCVDFVGVRRVDELAVVLHEGEGAAEEGLGGAGSETEDDFGAHGVNFREEPRTTGDDLAHAGVLVKTKFAALDEFEVLDGVRHEE